MGKPNKNKNKPQPPAASASAAEQPKKPEDQAASKQPGSETPGKIEQAQQATTPVSAPVPVALPISEKQGQPGSQTATSEKAVEKNVGPAPQVPPQSVTKTEPKEVKANLESAKEAVLPPTVKAEEKPGAEQKAKEITSNSGKPAGQDKKKEQNPGNTNRNQGKQNNKEQPKPNADKAGGKGKQKDNKAAEKPRETLEEKSQEPKVESPVGSESTPKDTVLKFSEVVSEKAQAPPAKLPEVVAEKPKEPEAQPPLVPEKPKQEGNQEKSNLQQQQQKKNAQNNNRKRTNSRQKTPENSGKVPGKAQEQPVKAVEKVAEKPEEKPVKAEEKVAEKPLDVPAAPAVVAQEKPLELLPKPAETSPEKLKDSVLPKVPEVQNQDATNKVKVEAPKSPPGNPQSGKQDSKNKSKANQQGKGQQNQNKVNSKGPQAKTPEPVDQKAQETIPKLPEPVVAAKVSEVAIKAPEIVGVTPKDPATKPKEADAIKAKQSPALSSSPAKEAEKGKKQPAQNSNPTKDAQSKGSETDKKIIESPKTAELEKIPEKESQNKPPEKAPATTKSEQQKPPVPEKKGKKQDQRKPATEKIQEAKKPEPAKPSPPSAGQKAADSKQEQSQNPVVEKSLEKKQTEVPVSDNGSKNKQKGKASSPAPEKLSENKKQQQVKITAPVVTPEKKQDKPEVADKIAEAPKKPVIKEVQNCAVCNKVANSRCGGCNNVNYCSKDHQKQHWKKHKGSCIAWKICTSPELGRYLTATRDIRPGEIIIQEKPLLLTPPKVTAPVCLSCYHELLPSDAAGSSSGDKGSDEDIKPCVCEKNCGWPLCSSSTCKQSRGDHEPECKAGANRGGVKVQNFGQEHPMYQAVGILRALDLQKNRPADFENFMSLQSSDPAAASADTPTFPDINVTVKLIRDFFQYSKQGITEDMVKKISGIIDLNGHEIPIPGNYGQINRRLIGVYYTSSFLEHNCRPNCTKTWDAKTDSRSIVIRSAIPIKKGEHLSISYVDPLWGTNDRQHFLQMTKFFTCKCSRCLDPTELGCHISSVRCQQIQCSTKAEVEEKSFVPVHKRSGMIVPMDPLNGESLWKCLTCNEQYPVKYASSIVDKIASEMEKFQEMRGDIAASEEFLKKFSKVLPPYHFFLLEIKVELAQLYGRTPEEPLPVLAPIKLLRKKVLCEELLQALNVIVPGLNRLRALILYELQATVGTLSKIKASVGDISAEMHFRELQKCHAQLSEVVRVLDWEPRLSVEYRRCDGARRELADLAATLADFSVVNEENKTPSLKITSSNAQAENIIPVAASRDRIDKLAAQSKLDDDELELF